MMKFKALLIAALIPLGTWAQTPNAEIEQLLQALETSGCQFSRNGSWYDSTKAREHLQRKYDYIAKRQPDLSAESLIELAASKSSVTGKPYGVRCGQAEPMESQRWFLEKLAEIRRSTSSKE